MEFNTFIFIFCTIVVQIHGAMFDRTVKNETVLKAPEFLAPDGLKPCTCGIFMSGQIKPRQQPVGSPIIMTEFDDHLQCDFIGTRKCQTKCIEEMINHISGKGPSACVLLDRDAYRERAYLFVKNCDDDWYATRISAGRELCCKDGKAYKCPL